MLRRGEAGYLTNSCVEADPQNHLKIAANGSSRRLFRPSAAVSRNGLMESCTFRSSRHGGAPSPEGEGVNLAGSRPGGVSLAWGCYVVMCWGARPLR